MIYFFLSSSDTVFAIDSNKKLQEIDIDKLNWLLGNSTLSNDTAIIGNFVGPKTTMVTPWSTNAVEITQNMGIDGIKRIEQFRQVSSNDTFDKMVEQKFTILDQNLFLNNFSPEPIKYIDNIYEYNLSEGLSLSVEEVNYLESLPKLLNRPLTDSEVFGFSQVNSEHCRHKIFNGQFVIDGVEKEKSLFKLIKDTSEANYNNIVSAYKDNVAFVKGPKVLQFSPIKPEEPSYYEKNTFDSVLSLKAETHNFPTTVEPFSGAATGSGGEIRDRMAGGQGSIPLAGTAVYMTSYPRFTSDKDYEVKITPRNWLYQTPIEILIKASNGASDFGNKFGQPLISGSLFTFEHFENNKTIGYDKVIMQAGGVGYGKLDQSIKRKPNKGDKIVILGGDNYRIGMGGAAVSSSDTGAFSNALELNAVQRSNPEMQKRVANTIRALVESSRNPIISIHDHGAGGHLNCLSELVEETGGKILINSLPIGDPSLSYKEIIGNESQERMGLIISDIDLPLLKLIAKRERAPLFVVGDVTNDMKFVFESNDNSEKPIDIPLEYLFGKSPKFVINDKTIDSNYAPLLYNDNSIYNYVSQVLQLESVACKDWLTNKVDRCVGGRVVKQQCCGPLQLPLNNCGVMALDFENINGIATSIGHSPICGLINSSYGSINSISEALTNLIWAPIKDGLKGISLSANWMWPCKNEGEDARLYQAVESCAEFAIKLGINIPTGKDSLSMKQKYNDQEVLAPGTVIISAMGHCDDINNVIEPVLKSDGGDIFYIDLSKDDKKLGGSAFAQILGYIGDDCPTIKNAELFAKGFDTIQELIRDHIIVAGHDISSGGLITCLLELTFSHNVLGLDVDLSNIVGPDFTSILFAENCGLIVQTAKGNENSFIKICDEAGLSYQKIGIINNSNTLNIKYIDQLYSFDAYTWRDIWFEKSYLFDKLQTKNNLAKTRFDNYKNQALQFTLPKDWAFTVPNNNKPKPIAAVVREKGSNSERELANALYLAGFEVRDVHMTDLISGRETLHDVKFLGAVGGFSNSDVLGSAKGWAGAFLYNEVANKSIQSFFERNDTLSIGICNGCQLFMEMNLLYPNDNNHPKMDFNDSHKHESSFTSVRILDNNSIMLQNLSGCTLGVWISHGEGKFKLPNEEGSYNIVAKYGYSDYPSNPNGSDYNTAMLSSHDGRHLATMPHIERSIYSWNWAYNHGLNSTITPWVQAFINAREWIEKIS